MIHGSLADLQSLLSVTPTSVAHGFSGSQVTDGRSRVYGGQFLGQGLMAAASVGLGTARSLHCYFIRAGAADVPITYNAKPLGARLVAVEGAQQDRLLFSMDVAYGAYADSPTMIMPNVPPPEECIPRERGIQGLDRNNESTWAVIDSPFDYRFVENIWSEDYRHPRHHVWFRARSPTSADMSQTLAQAMAAYFSDDTIMDNGLFPHGWQRAWQQFQTASLDHVMWFHAPVDLDQWLLFAQDSPVAACGRALTRGSMFDRQGVPVATVHQEILMRPPATRS